MANTPISEYLGPSADSLAREYTHEAISGLVRVLRDPKAKGLERIAAARELLDRGHGKAAQPLVPIGGGPKTLGARLAALSTAQLQLLVDKRLKANGAGVITSAEAMSSEPTANSAGLADVMSGEPTANSARHEGGSPRERGPQWVPSASGGPHQNFSSFCKTLVPRGTGFEGESLEPLADSFEPLADSFEPLADSDDLEPLADSLELLSDSDELTTDSDELTTDSDDLYTEFEPLEPTYPAPREPRFAKGDVTEAEFTDANTKDPFDIAG